MPKIYQHNTNITTLNQSLKKEASPPLFFYGKSGIGVFETALNYAKSTHCSNKKKSGESCNSCKNCLNISFFKSKEICIFSNDSRFENILFYQKILKNNLSKNPKKIIYFLLSEIYHLLYRHKIKLLNPLLREKKSYPEGVKLTDLKREKLIQNVYQTLNIFFQKKEIENIIADDFIEDIQKLQNCLDRTILPKEAIDKIFYFSKLQTVNSKIIIIQNIQDIHFSVIGKFLKTLEEPPPNTQFLLLSRNLQSLNREVIAPLMSRCLKFSFDNLNSKTIKSILEEKMELNKEVIKEVNFKELDNMSDCIDYFLSPHKKKIHENLLKIINNEMTTFHFLKSLEKNISSKQLLDILKQLVVTQFSKREGDYNKFRFLEKVVSQQEQMALKNITNQNQINALILNLSQLQG